MIAARNVWDDQKRLSIFLYTKIQFAIESVTCLEVAGFYSRD